jgi:ornithine cyclodeaminase
MRFVVLTAAEVAALLPMPVCIDAMAEVLASLSRGDAHQPLRLVFRPPAAAGLMAFMPAYQGGSQPVFGLKAIGIFPGNAARGLAPIQATFALTTWRQIESRLVGSVCWRWNKTEQKSRPHNRTFPR